MSQQSDERLIVVPYRPGRWRVYLLLVVVGLAVVALAAFQYGGRYAEQEIQRLRQSERQRAAELAAEQARLEKVRKHWAEAKIAAEVDRVTIQQIREELVSLRQTIGEQAEELAFYKGMMASDDMAKGLDIRSWEVEPGLLSGHYAFRLVVQQLATIHRLLRGSVSIKLVGEREGKTVTYAISDLSPQIEKNPVRLRFKYFQNIEGELELPQGFVPRQVVVVAQAKGKKSVTVERSFDWTSEEVD